ncbi:MAG: hypothetical protein DRN81_05565 [Thermoproteota archaeon]|nr:MAG: hypothetical protein DRN81_05565 [Candidatus Korarchaeota archaeon]
MGAEGVKVSADSILKHLAGTKLSKVGRPSAEEKLNRELEEMENGGENEAERYEVPIEEIFLPGDIAEYQERLKDMKPEDLRVKLTKLAFENRGLKRWIKNAVRQIADASTTKGGKIVLPPLPQGVPGELGIEDSSAGVTKVLKELMPQITQYKLVRDILRDSSDDDSGNKNNGMVEIESPDGTKMRLPAGSFIPGMFNPLMAQQGAEKKEETITIKLGDKELTGPASSVGLLYQTLLNQGANRESTVKIRGEDGEEREVPASALGAVLDLQKLMMTQKNEEKMITITDDNGKEITMPASFYSQYLMQQQMRQMQEQLKQIKESSSSRPVTHTQTVPDQTLASVLSAVSEMKDTMRRVNEVMNPQKLSELAVQGLMSKVEEFDRLRAIFGSGKEDAEVQKERIRQQTELQRAKILEEMKLKREQEKTKQVEAEAKKFEILASPPPVSVQQPVQSEPEAVPDPHAIYKKARELHSELFEKLNANASEDNVQEAEENESSEEQIEEPAEDLEGGDEEQNE